MLHVYFGTDSPMVRTKAISAASDSGAGIVRIESEQFAVGQINDAVSSISLFGLPTVYIIDTPSAEETMNDEALACAADMAASNELFIVIEGPLLAAAKKKWSAHAAVMEECAKAAGKKFDVFALGNALSERDKKTLWMLLCDAKAAGSSSEEIIGILWWQLKTLRLAQMTGSAQEANMSDYPYNKAKRALRNFKDGELERLSSSLLSVYHDGHGGVRDIELALEEWVLTV